jgi:hypothetical protein
MGDHYLLMSKKRLEGVKMAIVQGAKAIEAERSCIINESNFEEKTGTTIAKIEIEAKIAKEKNNKLERELLKDAAVEKIEPIKELTPLQKHRKIEREKKIAHEILIKNYREKMQRNQAREQEKEEIQKMPPINNLTTEDDYLKMKADAVEEADPDPINNPELITIKTSSGDLLLDDFGKEALLMLIDSSKALQEAKSIYADHSAAIELFKDYIPAGVMFQYEGVVYRFSEPKGQYVEFKKRILEHTRLSAGSKGGISLIDAKAAGFEVE